MKRKGLVHEQGVLLVLMALGGHGESVMELGPPGGTPRRVAPGVWPLSTGLALPCHSQLETGLDSGPRSPDPRSCLLPPESPLCCERQELRFSLNLSVLVSSTSKVEKTPSLFPNTWHTVGAQPHADCP